MKLTHFKSDQLQLRLAPPPPQNNPPTPGHNFFLPCMANSRGWGLLSCQIPPVGGGDEKRGQIDSSLSAVQHFSLFAQLNSAILSILMCNVFVSINVFFVIALGFKLRLHAVMTPVYGFSIVITLLTLKLIER